MTGRRMPTPGNPTHCTSVARPQANRSALIKNATSSGGKLERAAEDQRHSDRARIHDQDVLQAEGQKLGDRQDLIDRVRDLIDRVNLVGHEPPLHPIGRRRTTSLSARDRCGRRNSPDHGPGELVLGSRNRNDKQKPCQARHGAAGPAAPVR